MIWKENGSQIFTVKIAYRVALWLNNQSWAEHSLARDHRPMWNKIWSLNMPLKVRMFIWRACSNCVPTRDNLHRRRIDPQCQICHHRAETVSHILWECPFARNVWAMFKGRTRNAATRPQISSSFFDRCK